MKKLIFATGNENKMKEIRMILGDLDYEILSMKEAGIDADIVEDGKTFEENAIIKATAISKLSGCLVLADDSGLEVDYMDKMPGIYSARWMGEDTSYRIKNKAIIDKLEGVPDEKRTARFVCAIAAAFPDGRVVTKRGTIEGIIGSCLMAVLARHAVQSRDTSDGSLRELMGSVMIRSFSFRSMARQLLNCLRRRRTRSVTGAER